MNDPDRSTNEEGKNSKHFGTNNNNNDDENRSNVNHQHKEKEKEKERRETRRSDDRDSSNNHGKYTSSSSYSSSREDREKEREKERERERERGREKDKDGDERDDSRKRKQTEENHKASSHSSSSHSDSKRKRETENTTSSSTTSTNANVNDSNTTSTTTTTTTTTSSSSSSSSSKKPLTESQSSLTSSTSSFIPVTTTTINKEHAPPSSNPPSRVVYITGFVRPFTLPSVKELLLKSGSADNVDFWMNNIKSICLAMYDNVDQAKRARDEIYGLAWPVQNKNTLRTDFTSEEQMKLAKEGKLRMVDLPYIREITLSSDRLRFNGEENLSSSSNGRDNQPSQVEKKKTLDELFRKTVVAKPPLYWLPLSDEQVEERKRKERPPKDLLNSNDSPQRGR